MLIIDEHKLPLRPGLDVKLLSTLRSLTKSKYRYLPSDKYPYILASGDVLGITKGSGAINLDALVEIPDLDKIGFCAHNTKTDKLVLVYTDGQPDAFEDTLDAFGWLHGSDVNIFVKSKKNTTLVYRKYTKTQSPVLLVLPRINLLTLSYYRTEHVLSFPEHSVRVKIETITPEDVLCLLTNGWAPLRSAYRQILSVLECLENNRTPVTCRDLPSIWFSGTPNHMYTVAKKYNYPLAIKYSRPDLVYSSNRVVTDMYLFRTFESETYTDYRPIPGELGGLITLTTGETRRAVPVVRYAAGMHKGLYYGNSSPRYTYTSYYLEPESKTYLTYTKAKTWRNKYTAVFELSIKHHFELTTAERNFVSNIPIKQQHKELLVSKELPDDLRLTYEDIAFYNPDFDPEDWCVTSDHKIYAGLLLGLYGCEDVLDKMLYRLALLDGLDLVILTNVVGKHQIVQEVFDVRPQSITFANLTYPK